MELDGQDKAWVRIKQVVNKKKGATQYPTLTTKDKDGRTRKHITTEDKIQAFYSSMKPFRII